MTELCERHGISRKTGYKWAERYVAEGVEGLKDRAPKRCPHRTEDRVVAALVAARGKHPRWGPRNCWRIYESDSRIGRGRLAARHGLVEPRQRRRPRHNQGRPKIDVRSPNDLWSGDFKGEFLTGDQRYCYPLTVADRCSRYLLGCEGQLSTAHAGVQPSSSDCSARGACQKRSSATTEGPSVRRQWLDCRDCRSGGSSWGSSRCWGQPIPSILDRRVETSSLFLRQVTQ